MAVNRTVPKIHKWIPIESDEKHFKFIDEEKARRESYKLNLSGNADVKKAIKEVDDFIRRMEKRHIKKYKDEDIQNNTDYCLNMSI